MSLAPVDLVNWEPPPFVGFATQALLFAATLSNTPAEGVWIPVQFVKSLSLDIAGSMSTLSVVLIGSNAFEDPGNVSTVTVGGTVTTSDVSSITIQNASLPGATQTVSHTSAGGDTTATIAAALAAAINANTNLAALAITAAVLSSVITISYPSAAPPSGANPSTPSAPPVQNFTIFTGAVTGSATETLTIANASVGNTIGSAITALGLTSITPLPRRIKAQVNTLTGTGASVTGRLAGPA